MFSEFNEAEKPKTSFAKYSVKFNDLAVQMRPHRIAYLRLLSRPLHITVYEKVCGQTNNFAEPQRPPAHEVSKHDGKVYILCIILYEVG